ncbi:unnamed protein product [Cylindrotheca closterium]|uniref:Uncharacterized protein n=1 Tax=Cylindrotheca closterium TaxID=2856 RepID=A0AAD2CJC0_9STRA|nr:unnamed protein product [Cylindrotheca closterium]
MKNCSTCMLDLDLIYEDDLSIFSLEDTMVASIAGEHENQQEERPTKSDHRPDDGGVPGPSTANVLDGEWSISSDAIPLPISKTSLPSLEAFDEDDDWRSMSSDATTVPPLLSTTTSKSNPDQKKLPSIDEGTVYKLSRKMLRSARSRAMVLKNVYPDLRRRGFKLPEKKNKSFSWSNHKMCALKKANHPLYKKPSDFLRASLRG